jgi:hypothetical protein
MRATEAAWRLGMVAALSCWSQTGAACRSALETRKMSTGESVRVEPRSAGEWTVEVRREWEGQTGVGRAVVRAVAAPVPGQEPHVKLAGARAWLSLGRERLAAGQAAAAVGCARRGLDELGGDYAPLTATDSSVLKLAAAEEELAAGRAANAASTMLGMLDARARLYAEKHRETVVE